MSTGICRCCLSFDVPCKQLDGSYFWMGYEEVYSVILSETFNINVSSNRYGSGGICDACICRLRDAGHFRRQVLRVESQWEKRLSETEDKKSCGLFDAEEDAFEQFADVKTEAAEDGHDIYIGPLLSTNVELKEDASDKYEQIQDIEGKFIERSDNVTETLKHKMNTCAIVEHSNVTPFRDKVRAGYVCFYCDETYLDPALLRLHTIENHNKEKCNYTLKLKSIDKHVKVDITDLKCTICSQNINNLTSLKQHLVKEHNKKLFDSDSDKMLPFKLKKDPPFNCAMCDQQFETFKMLHQHMNTHYRNFVCDECSSGFVTLRRLKFHKTTHTKGEYACDACKKFFTTKQKLNFHIKGVHQGKWKRNKCLHCPEKFTNYYKKQKHMVEAHNEKKIEYRCYACDKQFTAKFHLTNHMKSYHLQEKNYQCQVCLLMFYARRDLQRHMPKHSDERFECNNCSKYFSSKGSLNKHTRTHVQGKCTTSGNRFELTDHVKT